MGILAVVLSRQISPQNINECSVSACILPVTDEISFKIVRWSALPRVLSLHDEKRYFRHSEVSYSLRTTRAVGGNATNHQCGGPDCCGTAVFFSFYSKSEYLVHDKKIPEDGKRHLSTLQKMNAAPNSPDSSINSSGATRDILTLDIYNLGPTYVSHRNRNP